jgi:hypothetical protein
MENHPSNKQSCCQRKPTHPAKKTKQASKTIGTGLSSTLLSSQRTTTHQKPTAHQGDPLPGHSLNFTASFRPCQPESPGSCRPDPVRPSPTARSIATNLEEEDGVTRSRTAAAAEPLARPFPCRKRTLPGGPPTSKSAPGDPRYASLTAPNPQLRRPRRRQCQAGGRASRRPAGPHVRDRRRSASPHYADLGHVVGHEGGTSNESPPQLQDRQPREPGSRMPGRQTGRTTHGRTARDQNDRPGARHTARDQNDRAGARRTARRPGPERQNRRTTHGRATGSRDGGASPRRRGRAVW